MAQKTEQTEGVEVKMTRWMILVIQSLIQLELENGNTNEHGKKPIFFSELLRRVTSKREQKSDLYCSIFLRMDLAVSMSQRVLWVLEMMCPELINYSVEDGQVALTRHGWRVARSMMKNLPPSWLSPAHQDVSA